MAVGDILARWDSRLDWSGERPAAGAQLLQRFEQIDGSGTTRTMPDAAGTDVWTIANWATSTAPSPGRWGANLSLNRTAPATEKTVLRVPYRTGMWPASGKLLFGAWASLTFAMSYTPIISTRNTPTRQPLVYLSTTSDGRPRAMLYSAAGTAILDQSEPATSIPWTQTANTWIYYAWMVDLDAKTSQVAMVKRDTGQTFLGPLRAWTGIANANCTADLEVASLSPAASYWAGGFIDEIGYWQPTTTLQAFIEQVRLSLPARGRDSADGAALVISDTGVDATGAATLHTGARPAAWTYRPAVTSSPATASALQALLSTDDGATWTAPTAAAALPLTFTGLVRWQVPLYAGETLNRIELHEQAPPPQLAPIADLHLQQNASASVAISGTWTGPPDFEVIAPEGLAITVDGVAMTVSTTWEIGDLVVAVSVRDSSGMASDPATFTVHVTAAEWMQPHAPYAFDPPALVEDGAVVDMLPDVWAAKLFSEINGEQYVTLDASASDRRAGRLVNEAQIRVAGQDYTIRQTTVTRDGGSPTIAVRAEAAWYDLARKPRLTAQAWTDSQPGAEVAAALAGTDWSVGSITVATRRTWSWQPGNPLEVLRQIQQMHGGDLTFDSATRTVSLLVTSGRNGGVFFTVGKNLKSVKRVLDTTQLVTRMHASTEDGQTFADVNGGLDYVENHTWSSTVADGHLTFKAGTNPYTMLAMTRASLGRYCKPRTTYEASVADLSFLASHEIEAFSLGDEVSILDEEIGIDITHKVVRLELDLLEPWNTVVTLSSTLRELGNSDSSANAAVLTTGTDIDTKDLVPFNLLLNARFDNGLAHWASSGATVVAEGVTGPNAVELAGGGTRWIEQTVAPDTRDVYTLSFQMASAGYPQGVTPELTVVAEITYTDGTTETITQSVT